MSYSLRTGWGNGPFKRITSTKTRARRLKQQGLGCSNLSPKSDAHAEMHIGSKMFYITP
jgi:hypothetical protein